MSEEEKKAIDKLKAGKKIGIYELIRTFKKEGIENFVTTRKKYVDTVLKLIENQQREIEKEKAYNEFYIDLCNKQQKEMKKLKEKTKKCEYYEMVADGLSKELEELKDKFSDEKIRDTVIKRYREVIEKDYTSKAKIKAKIEECREILYSFEKELELKANKDKFINKESMNCLLGQISILQSLLEKE